MSDQPVERYPQDFVEVLGHIQQARQRVLAQANTALIDLYWRIGQTLSQKVARAGWGKGVVTQLADYIAQADPTLKGFSDKNLWRMKQFYEAYGEDEKLSTLLRALPWSHNLAIFSRCKTAEERRFYLALTAKEKYTFRELDRQITASTFERTLAANVLKPEERVVGRRRDCQETGNEREQCSRKRGHNSHRHFFDLKRSNPVAPQTPRRICLTREAKLRTTRERRDKGKIFPHAGAFRRHPVRKSSRPRGSPVVGANAI